MGLLVVGVDLGDVVVLGSLVEELVGVVLEGFRVVKEVLVVLGLVLVLVLVVVLRLVLMLVLLVLLVMMLVLVLMLKLLHGDPTSHLVKILGKGG